MTTYKVKLLFSKKEFKGPSIKDVGTKSRKIDPLVRADTPSGGFFSSKNVDVNILRTL